MILRLVLFTLTFSLGEAFLTSADRVHDYSAMDDGEIIGTNVQEYIDKYNRIQQDLQDISIDIYKTDEQCIIDAGGCKSISNIDDFFEKNKQSKDLCFNPDGITDTHWGTLVDINVTMLEDMVNTTYRMEIDGSVWDDDRIGKYFTSTNPGGHGKFIAWFHGDYVHSKADNVHSKTAEAGAPGMHYYYPSGYNHDLSYVLLKFTTIHGPEIFQYDIDILTQDNRKPAFALFPLGTCNKPVEYVVFTPSEICVSDFNWYQFYNGCDNRGERLWKMMEKEMKQNYIKSQCETPKETRAIHADTKQAALLNGNLVEQIGDFLYVRGENGYNIPCTGSLRESFRVLSNGKILVVDGKTKLYDGQNVEKEFDGTQILAVAPDETSFLVGLTDNGVTTGIQLHFFDERSSITVSNIGGIVSYSPDGDYFAVQKFGVVETDQGFKKINTIFKLDGTQISQFYTDSGMTWGDDIIAKSASSYDMCSRYDINGNELSSFECPGFFYKADAYKDFMVTYAFDTNTRQRVTLYKDGTEIFASREITNNANPYFKDDKLYFMDSDRDVLVEIDLSFYSTESDSSTVLPKETLIRTYQEHYCD